MVRWFEWTGRYDCQDATDNPTVTTSYSDGRRSKAIVHYHGCFEHADKARLKVLTQVEDVFDFIVHSDRWVGIEVERRR